MTVMELKALPLGFRFHPTDEELVRHYLKGKITGQINSEVEVIPEINVYKCEPWDLPDKSLIRSDDPEWFFFAPKDRKHPNGSRSNRSTEAGYWKATGKDRVIRSKGDKRKQHIIGMKKTLVFHKGRAPKGERMGWIMHEYRTTEPDFECGKQGGYVLYRLFRKQEEKNERSSPEEVDRSGYSPTSRSSPDNMESNEETLTPLNKESPESTLHFSPINSPNSVEGHAVLPMTRGLADRTDNLTANAMNISRMPLGEHIDGVAKVDPSAGGLSQLIDSQKQHGDPNHFALGGAAVLPHEGNGFFTDFQQGSMGLDGNMNTPDAIDEFLNQTIADPDEHSLTTSKVQYESDTGILPLEFENHEIMQGELPEDERWWEGLSFLPEEPIPQLSGLYENASLIPYDATDQDVFSMDSGVESLQDLFNNMEDSNGKRDGSEPAMQETGITFMPRLQSSVQQNYLSPNQGTAQRRIRLLESLFPNVESEESATNVDYEDETSCIVTSKYLDEAVEESTTEKGVQSDEDDAESTGVTIRSTASSFTQQGIAPRRLQLQSDLTTGPCSTTNDSSSCIMDKTKSQHNARKSKIEEGLGTYFAVSVDLSGSRHDYEQNDMPEHDALKAVPEAKSVPRLRKTSEKSEKVTKQEDGADSVVRAQGRREASNYISGWFFKWLCCCFSVLGCMGGSDGYSGGI